jgi:hypothetical protein
VGKSRSHKPPDSGGKAEKISKLKRTNLELRKLINRQRRNVKDLTGIIVSAKRAAASGDYLRTAALVSVNIKYPPTAAVDCNHEWTHKTVDICKHCKEVFRE